MNKRRRVRYIVAAALIIGAVAFVLVQGLSSALVYFQTASQAVAHRAQLAGQDFNIEGAVVPGTIHRAGEEVDFDISSGAVKVAVVNQGSPPQLFKAGIPVVLEGHFQNGSVPTLADPPGKVSPGFYFASDQIMVKHSAQYVAAHPQRVKSPYATSTTAATAPSRT